MVKRFLKDIVCTNICLKIRLLSFIGQARQVGKTTLVNDLVKSFDEPVLFLNGDDADVRELFRDFSAAKFLPVAGNYKIVVLDEAQIISDIGLVIR